MITFIKTLPYQTKPNFGDVFLYIKKLGLQIIDPPALSEKPLLLTANVIFYSPQKRVADTIVKEQGKKYIATDVLCEILFDVEKLCSRQEYEAYKSVVVRKRFKEAFIANTLPIDRKVIFQQVRELLHECRQQSAVGDIAVVSHSFRLKIIEAFIKTKGVIQQKPELIHEYILDQEKTYDFGKGFKIPSEELTLF